MKCPNCGKSSPDGAVECAGCAVVFAKWQTRQPRTVAPSEPEGPGPLAGLLKLAVYGALLLGAYKGYSLYAGKRLAEEQRLAAVAQAAQAAQQEAARVQADEAALAAATAAAVAGSAPKAVDSRFALPPGGVPKLPWQEPDFKEKQQAQKERERQVWLEVNKDRIQKDQRQQENAVRMRQQIQQIELEQKGR